MYQYKSCDCNGLGSILDIASAFIGGSGSGSSDMTPGASTTVSPQISTQISPQISPNFQQQFQPQNSAMSAGTAQSVPAMPSLTGSAGTTALAPGYAPAPAVPTVPQAGTDWTKYMPYALAAMGIIAFVTIKKRAYKK
jgi:hypothetical protein